MMGYTALILGISFLWCQAVDANLARAKMIEQRLKTRASLLEHIDTAFELPQPKAQKFA